MLKCIKMFSVGKTLSVNVLVNYNVNKLEKRRRKRLEKDGLKVLRQENW